MAVKIRLARHGKKNAAFFHIVVADARAPRDGRFIERIGSYNPNTNPATIDLNVDKALTWIYKGAQPTDTCRRILSYKGVLMKKHLDGGVKKGALTQDQADAKFVAWLAEKDNKVASKVSGLEKDTNEARRTKIAAETKVNEARTAEIASKKAAELAKAAAEVEAAKAPVIEEVAVDEPKVEETPAE